MQTTFSLTIELGNDAMQTGDDLADALRSVASKIEHEAGPSDGIIRDGNGNTVGHFGSALAKP